MIYRDFIDHDIPIIGLHPILPSGACGCGYADCKIAGKHPIARAWQSSPVWSDDQLECMEEIGHFSTGYGVLLRGLLVIDIDARNGGVASFTRLLAEYPAIAGAGLIVETGSGGGSKHYYFRIDESVPLVSKLANYPGIDFKSSGYVVGPGSLHQSGARYVALVGGVDDIGLAPSALIAALTKPDRVRAEISGRHVDVSSGDIAEMLTYIPPDDYDLWIRVGMAIHETTGGAGFDLWDDWSRKSDKYDARGMAAKWHSFGKSATVVSFGTLAHHAMEGGWQSPVEFECSELFEHDDAPIPSGLPVDISGVDLLRPPGFVGELAHWIGQQPRRPREHLAVAAALVSVGNIIGLNYIDEHTGVTGNLFCFCVAGSGTGKEAIQQAMADIHQVAGLSPACHGTIKSEQEIMRNIAMRHQAAFYIIDELGTLFQKIKNAMDRGGASYLEGIIGLLMSAYSKANGTMLISGDLREEIRQGLSREIAMMRKLRDERDERFSEDVLIRLEQQIKAIDRGLVNPFLSIAGFTTPETFYACVNKSNATNGFFGRSLLFIEHETVPKFRNDHQTTAMTEAMQNAIILLASNGHMDMMGRRIEQTHERIPIPSTQDARDAMRAIRIWLDEKADAEKGASGLEAMYLRCYELIAKVAFIAAAPSGLQTLEHVQYAFSLVLRDIKNKINIVQSNDDKAAPESVLMARIRSLIGEAGETQGVLIQRANRRKRAEIIKMLGLMVENGCLRAIEDAGKNKIKTIRYFLV